MTTARYRFGTYEFDARTGELERDGQPVKLQPQPARVLTLLVERPGEVILRDDLKTHLWGQDTFVDFERGLNFCILQVRTALKDTSENPRFVQTVPRKGYRFIAPVSVIGGPSAASPAAPETVSSPALPTTGLGRRSWIAVASLAGVIVIGLGWLAVSTRLANRGGDAGRLRIAVLPIVNLTGDRGADYVADGVTDELIAGLGAVSPTRLGVIARTSVMKYRETTKSVTEIGSELNVDYVLEGSLRRDGERLRVSAELVAVGDQTQVWAETFERSTSDVMGLQSELSAQVARALALQLVPDTSSRTANGARVAPEAWDAYLQGRYWKQHGGTAEGAKALQLFEDAARLDPAFAAAWAEIADTRHYLVMISGLSPKQAYPRAQEAVQQALTLDSSLASAHIARGNIALWYDWSPQEAARELERGLALNPSDPNAHHDYAWALVALGRFDEAVAHMTTARDLDPLSSRANNDIGWLRLHLRQPTEAARACRQTLAFQPDSLDAQACLERAFMQRGLFDEAWRAAQASLPSGVDIVALTSASPDARERLRSVWRYRLTRLLDRAATTWVSPYQIAAHRLMLDDVDGVWPLLDEAFRERIGMLALLHTDPLLDPLRSDRRFEDLAAKVKSRGQVSTINKTR